jgi:PAS domain S-box-containing protein
MIIDKDNGKKLTIDSFNEFGYTLGFNDDKNFDSIIDQSPTAIIVATAPKGEVVYINDAVWDFRGETDAKLTGITIEEYVGSWKEFYPDGRQYTSEEMPLARSLMTGEVVYGEEIIVELDDGTRKWAIAYSSPIHKDDEIVAAIVIFSDITEIIQQKTKLQELNDLKNRLFKLLAHDLRSPYNAIIGFSELLLSSVEKGDLESVKRYALIIKESAQKAFLTTNNLLEWVLANSDAITPKFVKNNIPLFVSEIVEEIRLFSNKKDITIVSKTLADVDIVFDKDMIGSVVRNMLNNAVKFSNKHTEVVIKAEQIEDNIVFSIIDKGIGIAEEKLSTLFTSEKVPSQKGTDGEKGSGLGLSICTELINKHNGDIWAESTIDKGSMFCFTLPMTLEAQLEE